MAYDEDIEARILKQVSDWPGTHAKKMFGGICHLLNGNMFCGVHKDFLILKLGEKSADKALLSEHVRPFDITGRPMKGWVMVAGEGFENETELQNWLDQARMFVETLPPK
jgi:TfoX/Sxy family transcriptional regulator of competence genes